MDTNFVSLEKSQDGGDLYKSHKETVAYWTPIHDDMENCYRHLRGKQWTDAELALFKKKNKTALVFNQLKPAERTILGLFIQNKYDVKFSPRESNSQDISDVLQKLYAFTAYSQDWSFKDIELVRQAWTGGVGYMEMYVEVVPGQKPRLCSQIQNPFSIFWDPESRHLVTRDDAEYVDRDTWVAFPYLQEKWSEIFHEEADLGGTGQNTYQSTNVFADRSAQYYDTKNNRYKLTERYYKVRKKMWFAMDPDWKRLEIKDAKPAILAKYRSEGYQVFSEMQEQLYVAIICPAWNTGKYLYNGPYHCQPRDLVTGKIIWPFLELIAESLNGEYSGFVEHLIPANRLVNSSVSNIFHANKHAASTGLIRKKKLFGQDEIAASKFDKNHVDADLVHVASDAADLSADLMPIPSKTVSGDTHTTYEIGGNEFQRLSSTPPALQGVQEEAGTSGILNSQRIEQSFVQLQPLIANIKYFLRRRAELAYYYWREYWTYPMEFRLIGGQSKEKGLMQPQQGQGQGQDPQAPQGIRQNGQHQFMTLNQEVPVTDWQGAPTGALQKINDITVAEMDVDIEDSYQSPTYRAKMQQQLSDMMEKAQGVDPGLLEALFGEYAKNTDMAQESKDAISQSIQERKQAASQPPPPPPPEPPKISFSFKGEDLSNPATLEVMRATGMLPPDVIDRLEAHAQPPPIPGAPAPADPLAVQKHSKDMKLADAKLEGAHLDNAKKMQDVADKEAAAVAGEGLVPSVAKSFAQRPNSFAPMGAR